MRRAQPSSFRTILVGSLACLVLVKLLVAPPALAQGQEFPDDLTAVSLEDLTRIRVTSVAKKEQSLSEVAGALFVVTGEDIRRMGATSIPEALRFVPGVHVARMDAGKWAVSVRGFNGRYSNKLLALIDGRPIYSSLFSSVFWELYDIPVEDIARIEVLRGPGATMWGSNAVNGVINVITKPAAETQGGRAALQGGSYDGALSTVRYGGQGPAGAYRVFVKSQRHLSSPEDDVGVPVEDGWRSLRGGFTCETAPTDRDRIGVQGGVHRMTGRQRSLGPALEPPLARVVLAAHEASTGFLSGRWEHSLSDRSELSLKAYYDYMSKREENVYGVSVSTAEVELEHRFRHNARLDLNWGLAYRAVFDDLEQTPVASFQDDHRHYRCRSAFVQEEAQLLPEELYLTVGVKVEHNTLGGFAAQPTARLLWAPSPRHSFWTAVSRAARAPSRGEIDARFDIAGVQVQPGLVGFISVFPNPQLGYETVTAYEGGFRVNGGDGWSLDVAYFENVYRDLARVVQRPPQLVLEPKPHLLIPIQLRNTGDERSRGVELSFKWRPIEKWDLTATGAFHRTRIGAAPSAFGSDGRTTPWQTYSLQSHWKIRRNLELSCSALRVGSVGATGVLNADNGLPRYVRGDARLEWKTRGGARFSVGVQDAFPGGRYELHPESNTIASPVRRNVYGRAEWGF